VRILVAYVAQPWCLRWRRLYRRESRRAEIILIPLLDILQSIPCLVSCRRNAGHGALFPAGNWEVELGSIILIFTGQVLEHCLQFYSSLKTIPRDLREAGLFTVSAPAAVSGAGSSFFHYRLVWNSMMSVRWVVLPDGVRNVRAG